MRLGQHLNGARSHFVTPFAAFFDRTVVWIWQFVLVVLSFYMRE